MIFLVIQLPLGEAMQMAIYHIVKNIKQEILITNCEMNL